MDEPNLFERIRFFSELPEELEKIIREFPEIYPNSGTLEDKYYFLLNYSKIFQKGLINPKNEELKKIKSKVYELTDELRNFPVKNISFNGVANHGREGYILTFNVSINGIEYSNVYATNINNQLQFLSELYDKGKQSVKIRDLIKNKSPIEFYFNNDGFDMKFIQKKFLKGEHIVSKYFRSNYFSNIPAEIFREDLFIAKEKAVSEHYKLHERYINNLSKIYLDLCNYIKGKNH